jgi:hypothetical protein
MRVESLVLAHAYGPLSPLVDGERRANHRPAERVEKVEDGVEDSRRRPRPLAWALALTRPADGPVSHARQRPASSNAGATTCPRNAAPTTGRRSVTPEPCRRGSGSRAWRRERPHLPPAFPVRAAARGVVHVSFATADRRVIEPGGQHRKGVPIRWSVHSAPSCPARGHGRRCDR